MSFNLQDIQWTSEEPTGKKFFSQELTLDQLVEFFKEPAVGKGDLGVTISVGKNGGSNVIINNENQNGTVNKRKLEIFFGAFANAKVEGYEPTGAPSSSSQVEDTKWYAAPQPQGAFFYSSRFTQISDAKAIEIKLKEKKIEAFVKGEGPEEKKTYTVCVNNYAGPDKLDPKKIERFFAAFPSVVVDGFDNSLLKKFQAANNNASSDAAPAYRPIDEVALKIALDKMHQLVGLQGAKKKVEEIVSLVRDDIMCRELGIDDAEPPYYHMVFAGSPGTGKTTFARLIAEIFYALGITSKPSCHEVTKPDLVGAHIGETEEKTAAHAQEAMDGVLFVDEAYALSRSDSPRDFGYAVIDTLVPIMENYRDRLIVIFAGYTKDMEKLISSNRGLKSRCVFQIDYEDYDSESLSQIMEGMLKKQRRIISEEGRKTLLDGLESIRKRDAGNFGNAREVRNLLQGLKLSRAARLDTPDMRALLQLLPREKKIELLSTYTLEDAKAAIAGIKFDRKKKSKLQKTTEEDLRQATFGKFEKTKKNKFPMGFQLPSKQETVGCKRKARASLT